MSILTRGLGRRGKPAAFGIGLLKRIIGLLIDLRFFDSPRVRLAQVVDGRSFTMEVTSRDLEQSRETSFLCDPRFKERLYERDEPGRTVIHEHSFEIDRSR